MLSSRADQTQLAPFRRACRRSRTTTFPALVAFVVSLAAVAAFLASSAFWGVFGRGGTATAADAT